MTRLSAFLHWLGDLCYREPSVAEWPTFRHWSNDIEWDTPGGVALSTPTVPEIRTAARTMTDREWERFAGMTDRITDSRGSDD